MAFSTNYDEQEEELKPEGEYECVITAAQETATRWGTPCVDIQLQIRRDVSNPCGGKIFHKLWKRKPENQTAADRACDGYSNKQIQNLSKSARLPNGKSYESLSAWCKDLINTPVRVTLEHETYNGRTQERVKWFDISQAPAPTESASDMEQDFIAVDDDEDVPF